MKIYFRNKRGVSKAHFQDHLWYAAFMNLCKRKGRNPLQVLLQILASKNGTGLEGLFIVN